MAQKKIVVEKLARTPNVSLEKHTDRNWDEWIKILDQAGARRWSHREMTDFLAKKHKLTPWWRQIVAIGYQTHIGMRAEGRNLKGEFSITITKMTSMPAKKAWALSVSPKGLATWLQPMGDVRIKPKTSFEIEGGIFGEIRTVKAGERIRLAWSDSAEEKPSTVQFSVFKKGDRSMIVIQHDGLRDGRLREILRARWRKGVDELVVLGSSQKAK